MIRCNIYSYMNEQTLTNLESSCSRIRRLTNQLQSTLRQTEYQVSRITQKETPDSILACSDSDLDLG
jgi:hypothetical protein